MNAYAKFCQLYAIYSIPFKVQMFFKGSCTKKRDGSGLSSHFHSTHVTKISRLHPSNQMSFSNDLSQCPRACGLSVPVRGLPPPINHNTVWGFLLNCFAQYNVFEMLLFFQSSQFFRQIVDQRNQIFIGTNFITYFLFFLP